MRNAAESAKLGSAEMMRGACGYLAGDRQEWPAFAIIIPDFGVVMKGRTGSGFEGLRRGSIGPLTGSGSPLSYFLLSSCYHFLYEMRSNSMRTYLLTMKWNRS